VVSKKPERRNYAQKEGTANPLEGRNRKKNLLKKVLIYPRGTPAPKKRRKGGCSKEKKSPIFQRDPTPSSVIDKPHLRTSKIPAGGRGTQYACIKGERGQGGAEKGGIK